MLSATLIAALLGAVPAGAIGTAGGATSTTTSTSTTLGAAGRAADVIPTTTTVRSVPLGAVNGAYLDGVSARLRAAERDLTAAQNAVAILKARDSRSTAALQLAQARLDTLSAQDQAAVHAAQVAGNHLRVLVVSSYVDGGPIQPLNVLLGARSISDFAHRQQVLRGLASSDALALHAYQTALAKASAAARKALVALDRARAVEAQAHAQVAAAMATATQRTNALNDLVQLLQLVTAASVSPGTDIPSLVLDAYRRAAAAVQATGCQLPWAALAAIGAIESDHGRAHQAGLTITGDILPPIIGPRLDGNNGTAVVPDTDNGRWDGDPLFQHAVGPMQILPSTWAVVGRDGNGDGVADPNNIYDAALGAAVYLCRASPSLSASNDQALSQAFFSYNHADFYVTEALALTHLYEAVTPSP